MYVYLCKREYLCCMCVFFICILSTRYFHSTWMYEIRKWNENLEWTVMNWFVLCCIMLCWCCQHEHKRRCTVAFYVSTVLKMFKCSRWIKLSSRWLAIAIATCVLCLLYFCNCGIFPPVCMCVFECVCVWVVQWNHVQTSGSYLYCKHIAFYSQIVYCLFLSWLHENIQIQCFLCTLVCLFISLVPKQL